MASPSTPVKPELFEAALLKTQKTWKTYITALCTLDLGLLIDWLGGSRFIVAGDELTVAGFKVVREALSATYGLLFLVFILAVFFESRLLRKLSQTAVHLPESPEFALWFLSPFSWSVLGRFFWKALFVNGYYLLGVFTFIHITNKYPSTKKNMLGGLYIEIGYVDLLILLLCLGLGVRIYLDLQSVRRQLAMIEGRNT